MTVATARLLGPDGRGLLVAVISWVTLFATVAGLSLGEVSQYWIQSSGRRDWLPTLLGSMLSCMAGLSVLAVVAAIVFYWSTGGEFMRNVPVSLFAVGLLIVPFLVWEQYARYLLLGAGKVRIFNIAQVLGGTVGIAAVLLFLTVWNLGVSGALFAHLSGVCVLGAVAFASLWRVASFRIKVEIDVVRRLFGGALKLHLNTIGVLLMAHTNILMLNHFSTVREVGWYQFSLQLIMAMLIIPQAASMILFSRVAEIGPDRTWPEQKRLIGQMFGVMTVLSTAAFFAAPEIVTVLAGQEFTPSIKAFRLLLPVLFGMSLAVLMAPQWIGRGIFLPTSILTLCTGVANISLNFILIPSYGMMGAIWAMNISYFAVVVVGQLVFAGWVERKSRAVFSD